MVMKMYYKVVPVHVVLKTKLYTCMKLYAQVVPMADNSCIIFFAEDAGADHRAMHSTGGAHSGEMIASGLTG